MPTKFPLSSTTGTPPIRLVSKIEINSLTVVEVLGCNYFSNHEITYLHLDFSPFKFHMFTNYITFTYA